jgi:hypothetical protein
MLGVIRERAATIAGGSRSDDDDEGIWRAQSCVPPARSEETRLEE